MSWEREISVSGNTDTRVSDGPGIAVSRNSGFASGGDSDMTMNDDNRTAADRDSRDNRDIVGMILAAGEGTRMRPLTLYCPKPLLPFQGVPILQRISQNLRELGLLQVGVNAHHLADSLSLWVQQNAPELLVHHEQTLLGSGGGVRAMSERLPTAAHFLYHNGDILTDASLQALIDHHRRTDADVTMLLTAGAAADGNVGFERSTGRIVALPGQEGPCAVPCDSSERTSFGGVMIFRRELIDRLPDDQLAPCIIRQALTPLLLAGGNIQGLFHDGLFSDLGTHERWLAGLRSVQTPPFADEYLHGIPETIVLHGGGDTVRFLPAKP